MPKPLKPVIYVICGPTATGKSDYAVKLAKEINGEILSADSRQVYRGLDIGSGKITKKEMMGITHHLLDLASPKRIFTVSQFKKFGEEKIKNIIQHKKTPIICGGTGFYIDTLLGQDLPQVSPNKKLRSELNKKSLTELQTILKKLDSARYKNIDQQNKVRLIRSIEIATELGSVPKIKKISRYKVNWIGLDFTDEILKKRIHVRLHKRLNQGMIQEVKNLNKNGLSFKRLEELGLEYRYVSFYLQKKITKKELFEQLEISIWHYAKRQRTWFKKNKEIKWIIG